MNTKQLKAKVLDLAIHGKLLSPETVAELKKSPDYETADVLLEKIRKEKEEKIAKGELKRDKKDSYIFVGDDKRHYEKFADGNVKDIEDEIPFDVPEGWAWASLSEIANIYTGNSINENEKANKYSNLKEGLFYIATKDIDFEGKINYNNGIRIPLTESKFKIAPAESTLLCIEGGSAGRKIGFINQDVCFVNKLCCFHSDYLSNLYLFYYLQSRTFIDLFNSNKSGLIGGVSLNLLKSIFIPVAPAIEQDLISKTIATYLEKITSLNKDKETLELTIKKAKSKILDLAIHGKLVPQDANDEPASILLEKLRAEKEEKIAKGELKRDKNDSYIYKGSDNCYYEKFVDGTINQIDVPFDLPYNWSWCKLNELANISRGGSPRPIENYITTDIDGINWIKIGDTSPESKYIIGAKEKIKPSGIKHSRFVHSGDFLLTNSMSFGRPYILKINGCIHDGWLVFSDIKSCLDQDYLYYALSSKYIYNAFSLVAAGSTVKNLKSDTVKQVIFPIPPIEEQKRIVLTIDKLFTELKQIQNNFI